MGAGLRPRPPLLPNAGEWYMIRKTDAPIFREKETEP